MNDNDDIIILITDPVQVCFNHNCRLFSPKFLLSDLFVQLLVPCYNTVLQFKNTISCFGSHNQETDIKQASWLTFLRTGIPYNNCS